MLNTTKIIKKNYRVFFNKHFIAIFFIMLVLTILHYYRFRLVDYFRYDWQWLWRLAYFEYANKLHGILFCIPIIYSAVICGWRGSLIAWVASIIIIFPRAWYLDHSMLSIANSIVVLFTPCAIVGFISMEISWRKKEKDALFDREEERKYLLSKILSAQEDERQHIARELHDEYVQELLVIAAHADTIISSNGKDTIDPKTKDQAVWIREKAIAVSDAMRQLSIDLRPNILDNLGLIPALRDLVTHLNNDGINARIEVIGSPRSLTKEININIYRIVQEALNNVRRHSKANEAQISTEFNREGVIVTIKDNGIGFTVPKTSSVFTTSGKLGLIGMEQRIQLLHGTFNVYSEAGKGTKIIIEIKV